jgi:hypothetical protein
LEDTGVDGVKGVADAVAGVDVLRWNGNIEDANDGDGDLDRADESENRRCSSDLMETR